MGPSQPPCATDDDLPWSYAYLIAVTPADDGLELTCGDEADRPSFQVHCRARYSGAFSKYFEIFTAWRLDPGAVEPPLIPLHRERSGQASFSLRGAIYDYPELCEAIVPSPRSGSHPSSHRTRRLVHVLVDAGWRPL